MNWGSDEHLESELSLTGHRTQKTWRKYVSMPWSESTVILRAGAAVHCGKIPPPPPPGLPLCVSQPSIKERAHLFPSGASSCCKLYRCESVLWVRRGEGGGWGRGGGGSHLVGLIVQCVRNELGVGTRSELRLWSCTAGRRRRRYARGKTQSWRQRERENHAHKNTHLTTTNAKTLCNPKTRHTNPKTTTKPNTSKLPGTTSLKKHPESTYFKKYILKLQISKPHR